MLNGVTFLTQVNEPGLVLSRFEIWGKILSSLNISLILETRISQSYGPPLILSMVKLPETSHVLQCVFQLSLVLHCASFSR
jgi:hypothetical protein